MEKLRPIHDPAQGPLPMAALMSGSGTNVRKILEHGERLAAEGLRLFDVRVIFTDNSASRAAEIGRDFDLPVIVRDLGGWLKKQGVERRDLKRREEYDREVVELLRPFAVKVAIYGGYMSIASPTLVHAFVGVNVHPADLSILTPQGKRKWIGAHAVADAIAGGERTLRATTHLVSDEVDMGQILMISAPLAVEIPAGEDLSDPEVLKNFAELHQNRLKEIGDWVIFPRTLEAIARGWFQTDKDGRLYYQGEPAGSGVRLEADGNFTVMP